MALTQDVAEVSGRVRFAPTQSIMYGSDLTVVRLEGEHDIANLFALSETLAIAIAFDDCDLVIDLSGVEFMGAETVGVLIRARNFLHDHARTLTLRAPAPCARRVLDLCWHDDFAPPLTLVAPVN